MGEITFLQYLVFSYWVTICISPWCITAFIVLSKNFAVFLCIPHISYEGYICSFALFVYLFKNFCVWALFPSSSLIFSILFLWVCRKFCRGSAKGCLYCKVFFFTWSINLIEMDLFQNRNVTIKIVIWKWKKRSNMLIDLLI